MKILRIVLLFILIGALPGNATIIKGCVINDANQPVEFATIVLLSGDKQVSGTTTDFGGCFSLPANTGNYNLRISFVGLSTYNNPIEVGAKDIDLGKIALPKSSVMMKEVEIKASAIRREADRYVMNVEDLPTTIGKDGADLLKQAPGVWISDDKISINGKSGTKVFINDRELKMSNDQLMNYLKSLTAEDVSKIEIIPDAGAEFSADMQGGIVKITLKKNRGDGLMGNVGLRTAFGKKDISIHPNARINYKTGKWAFSASTWWKQSPRSSLSNTENTVYRNIDSELNSSSINDQSGSIYGGGTIGAFYDIDNKNSLGIEIGYTLSNWNTTLNTNSDFRIKSSLISTLSEYLTTQKSNNVNASFNYIHKLDTVGSTLKFLANYIYDDNKSNANNHSQIITNNISVDSIFRNDISSQYNVLNTAFDFDKVLNKKWKLKSGAKYTFNNMNNHAYYDYLKHNIWVPSTKYNYDVKYNENIFALYAVANAIYGRFAFNAGLRGEYTNAVGEGGYINQNYFDLFPNANINYSLTAKGDYSISARYSRIISRPSFWALNPVKMQISDYSYQMGNPNLKAAYANSVGLTFALAYKYSLSIGYSQTNNAINQVFIMDPENPKNMNLTFDNQAKKKQLYVSVYAPIDITKWWTTTINATYVRSSQQESPTANTANYNYLLLNGSMNFTLPYEFFFEARAFYQNRIRQGNVEIEPYISFDVTLKKTFNKNKWVASVGTQDLLSRDFILKGVSDDFTRVFTVKKPLSIRLSITYNFNVGKKFKERNIESIDDASRMQKK